MILGLLARFPGYTLGTLMAEDTQLVRLTQVAELGGVEV